MTACFRFSTPRFLFSSDLKRAQQAAAILAARFAIEPLTDARLREVHLGDWDGQPWESVIRTDAARYDAGSGVELNDGPTRPAVVQRIRESAKRSFVEITIS